MCEVQPHFHPPPFIEGEMPSSTRFPSYSKAPPLPIPPHDSITMKERLEMPFTRNAWIVPIRGTLPGEDTSRAFVWEAPSQRPSPPSSASRAVTWTRPCLLDFWTFLLSLR